MYICILCICVCVCVYITQNMCVCIPSEEFIHNDSEVVFFFFNCHEVGFEI